MFGMAVVTQDYERLALRRLGLASMSIIITIHKCLQLVPNVSTLILIWVLFGCWFNKWSTVLVHWMVLLLLYVLQAISQFHRRFTLASTSCFVVAGKHIPLYLWLLLLTVINKHLANKCCVKESYWLFDLHFFYISRLCKHLWWFPDAYMVFMLTVILFWTTIIKNFYVNIVSSM